MLSSGHSNGHMLRTFTVNTIKGNIVFYIKGNIVFYVSV